jgi:medium-chain acyl-[acyl-carrier-protein] hydrolase
MIEDSVANPFLARPLDPHAVIRLFCLPYAGAGASRYFRWQSYFPSNIEVCPILLPGREARLNDSPFSDIQTLVDALAQALRPVVDRPYAVFGHSMGALIGFELTRCLWRETQCAPVHLFVSGHRAPHLHDSSSPMHHLPDLEFCERVRRLDGASPALLDHPEYRELMLPALRADFTLCGSYTFSQGPPLDCPISVFGGVDDHTVSHDALTAWEEHTSGRLIVRLFAGGHLFVNRCEREVAASVLRDLIDRGNGE